MVRLERRQSPVRWRERHHALAAAYQSWRTGQFPQESWDEPGWRALRLEETYHRLCADPGSALPGALAAVVHACAELPAAAAQWAQAIAQAGLDTDAPTIQACGQRLEDALRLDQHEATAACLDVILSQDRLPDDVLPVALRTRGRALYYLDRDAEALVDLNKAIALTPEDSRALAYRGAAHLWLDRNGEALADLDKAIELDPDYQWAIARRGETYRQMGRYEQALADFDKGIELDPDQRLDDRASRPDLLADGPLRAGPGRLRQGNRTGPQRRLDGRQPRPDLPADGPLRAGPGRLRQGDRTGPQQRLGDRASAARPTGRWTATSRPWPTSTRGSNWTPGGNG